MREHEYVPAPELEQLPGEPARWFERFIRYALLPPERRSVLAVYRSEVEAAQKGTKKPNQEPGAWKVAIVNWRWKQRAAEHDDRQRAILLAEHAEARTKMNQHHIRVALAMQERAVEWLLDRQNKLRTPQDVVIFLRV